MVLNNPWISASVGLVCGILSGFGIGGGSLLMVWMTAVAALDQQTAQAINLLYFLPTSIGALICHIKNHMVDWHAAIPVALSGCISAGCTAWFASNLDVTLLRKLFGLFLIIVGLYQWRKKPS